MSVFARALAVLTLVGGACTQPSPVVTDIDAEDLRAAALSQSDLGGAYSSFQFDSVFGGFETNEERARDKSDRPNEERQALERSGRLAAYQSMYVPRDQSAAIVRIFTLVGVFRDATGASDYFSSVAMSSSSTAFDVSGLGDQAKAWRERANVGPQIGIRTRAVVRRGRLLGTVGINRRDELDVNAEVAELARKLDERLRRAASGELRVYQGARGTEIGAERLQSMALPLPELGPAYSGFVEDLFLSAFQDNEERAGNVLTFDSADELQEFERRGRVTGYFEAFAAPDGRTPVSTGAHLFRDDAGAKEFLARFAERCKRLAGGTIGPQRIESVNDVAAPTLGDGAVAVALAIPGAHRVTVLVRRGRVVGETVVVRTDDAQARAEALDLARKLDARTTSALKR